MDYSEVDDVALFELYERANLAEKLESDPAWEIVREASSRIVERTIAKFAMATDPTKLADVIAAQVTIKKYKYGLFDEIKQLQTEREYYEKELVERQMLEKKS